MKNKHITIFACVSILFVVVCLGCSSETFQVSGTVKFPDGTPLTTGSVIMETDSFLTQGAIAPNGSFSMGLLKDGQGIPAGNYRVAIQGVQSDENTYLVAEKFMNPSRSGITFNVEEKKQNRFDITVEHP